MRKFLLISILLTQADLMYGQTVSLLDLADKMFFNILNHKPDSQVYDFVKKHVPYFTQEPYTGGWTAYPPGPFPATQPMMHSLVFTEHPCLFTKFREGRLDILTTEDSGDGMGIRDLHLWFFFDTKNDAEKAFEVLSSLFEPLSKSHSVSKKNGRKVASYDSKSDKVPSDVEFILLPDDFYKGKYRIFFRLGAYTYDD